MQNELRLMQAKIERRRNYPNTPAGELMQKFRSHIVARNAVFNVPPTEDNVISTFIAMQGRIAKRTIGENTVQNGIFINLVAPRTGENEEAEANFAELEKFSDLIALGGKDLVVPTKIGLIQKGDGYDIVIIGDRLDVNGQEQSIVVRPVNEQGSDTFGFVWRQNWSTTPEQSATSNVIAGLDNIPLITGQQLTNIARNISKLATQNQGCKFIDTF